MNILIELNITIILYAFMLMTLSSDLQIEEMHLPKMHFLQVHAVEFVPV